MRSLRRMALLIALVALGLAPGLAEAPDSLAAEIGSLLDRQAQDWSRGDIDAFVSAYADDVVFVSPTGLTRGRQEVRDRYVKRYPDKSAMGTLSLEVVEAEALGNRGASVVARWTLSYPEKDALTGWTLLVLMRDESSWKILHDASM